MKATAFFVMAGLVLFCAIGATRAADTIQAGKYTGEWKSGGETGGGPYKLSLEQGSDGTWKCEVAFSVAGEEAKVTACAMKAEQLQLETTVDFEVQGAQLRSKSSGQWNGNGFSGSYQTTAADTPVDMGTWSVTAAK